ncbi:MAG TPA: DUF1330 domain-containing protein [Mycobacterium sp.]|uniref:DUF1330 domain-containing protein n=1 Tax=Mycobacterium sp. TaxID=1785 RepID=UPI002C1900C9|nr:DUF1330 domain-containing protein [Mycobacterium sp.]HME75214.1 DUF1330 domain-containing protein [Mycobacterium sp.]
MEVENALYPTHSGVEALMADDSGRPVVMLNLLKFRAKAVYADGRPTELTGRQAYDLYAGPMQKVIDAGGGKVLFGGDIASLVIGDVADLWDTCVLVEYPTAAAFAAIVTSPEVAEIGVHRAAGLDGQLLIRVAQLAL